MQENIYDAPQSNLEKPREDTGSVAKGVIWGTVIDILGSIIFSILISVCYGVFLVVRGLNAKQAADSMTRFDPFSPIGLWTISIGALISCLAGYVCAKKSGDGAVKSTIILSCISGGFTLLMGIAAYSLSQTIVLTLLTIAAIFLGAKMWELRNTKIKK